MDLLGVSQHDFWDDMRAQGYADQRVRHERETRERAEKALREPRNNALTEAATKVQQTILLLRGDDCLAEAVMEAVLSLKSSEKGGAD